MEFTAKDSESVIMCVLASLVIYARSGIVVLATVLLLFVVISRDPSTADG
jgi:hypothetical protein